MRKSRSLELLLYCTLHPSIVEGEQVQHVTAVLYFTAPVLVRKSRSLKLLLYCTLHPGIVEGEQVQHVTAVLYFTPQYW